MAPGGGVLNRPAGLGERGGRRGMPAATVTVMRSVKSADGACNRHSPVDHSSPPPFVRSVLPLPAGVAAILIWPDDGEADDAVGERMMGNSGMVMVTNGGRPYATRQIPSRGW